MRILLLSDLNSVHTIKWVRSLAENDLEIYIFGLSKVNHSFYENYKNIKICTLGVDNSITGNSKTTVAKLKYLKAIPQVKDIIRQFKPDIVHAHYATSYGLIGALSGFHPYILSVWGADIFEFPLKSPLHRELLRFNLRKADKILSTSHFMAKATHAYTSKPLEITPFGIDLAMFKPREVESPSGKNSIVIGTIKSLEEQYGVEYLIRAFNILHAKYPNLSLKLLIVGGGSLEYPLKALVKELNLENETVFTGRIDYDLISHYHNMLSIYVALSVIDSESFGVAVIEASACEKPVVVSNVGGLPEVVEDGATGFVVPPRNPEKAAEAIEKLILDKELCLKMGRAGRKRVKKLYRWDDNVKQLISIYQIILESYQS
jgi:glycosyltransferase involved in cell wall biosynthesis